MDVVLWHGAQVGQPLCRLLVLGLVADGDGAAEEGDFDELAGLAREEAVLHPYADKQRKEEAKADEPADEIEVQVIDTVVGLAALARVLGDLRVEDGREGEAANDAHQRPCREDAAVQRANVVAAKLWWGSRGEGDELCIWFDILYMHKGE